MSRQVNDRWGRGTMRAAVFALGLLLLVLVLQPAGAQPISQGDWTRALQSLPTELTYTFTAPAYTLSTDEQGNSSVALPGFYAASLPGDPDLPAASTYLALPPLVPLDSVRLEIVAVTQTELPGTYTIAPAPPFLPAAQTGPYGADWGPNAATILAGRNTLVYERDSFFPAQPVELAGLAHMRKWRVATLRYWPFSINPVTGRLRLTSEITVRLRFDAPRVDEQSFQESFAEVQDTLMDDRAAASFDNFAEAQPWYDALLAAQPRTPAAKPGYAIITTNAIRDASTKLDAFVQHKTTDGYAVQVVTEDDYGPLTGQAPNLRADKVRQWLGDHWKSDNLLYVLLIGNPNPVDNSAEPEKPDIVGDLPMKMIDDTPTDFYFADLYSTDPINWDWWAEVYVGRIPVYQSDGEWVGILDSILQKTINYENETNIGWRRSALLPMAFLGTGSYDGAELAELMKDGYLDNAGFSVHRLYWHGAVSYSSYNGDEELVDGAVRNRWASNPPGIVTWYGHGSNVGAAIYDEYSGGISGLGTILESRDTTALNDAKPALVFQTSCETGWPENPGNLGYSLLKHGAVGTVSGSRNTTGFPGVQPGTDAHNVSLAYNYMKRVTQNEPVGQALFAVKKDPGGYETNALAYNLYGDPSIRLGVTPLGRDNDSAEMLAGQEPVVAAIHQPGAGEETMLRTAYSLSDTPFNTRVTDLTFGRIIPNEPDQILSVGQMHTCAVMPDGAVDCRGDDWKNTDYWRQDADQAGPYAQVTAGLYTTCGLKPDGSVHCWGRPDYDFDVDQPGPYTQISANYLHVCGLTPQGDIECWGNNDAGQAEDQSGNYVQVSTGMQHTCGLTAYGEADCWGRNTFGQANDRPGPFVQIDAGYFHTCALTPEGDVDCWGANHHGQAQDQIGPYTQLSVGLFNSCALGLDRTVHCWGKNDQGQTVDKPGPYVRVSTNVFHTVGLKADGTLDIWGGWMKPAELPGPFGQYRPELQRMAYNRWYFGDNAHYTAIHLADMNGDGQPEILIGNRDADSLEIWRSDSGYDMLVKIGAIPLPADIHDIKAADFDDDGDMDLVVGLRIAGLHYLTNTGAPGSVDSWTVEQLDATYSWQVQVLDLDNDGHLDILDGVDKGPIKTFYGDGQGGFEAGVPVRDDDTDMRFTTGFTAVYLDDDGFFDLIGMDGSYLRAFLNPGDRTAEWTSVGPNEPYAAYPCCTPNAIQSNLSPSVGDFDRNGVVDQVAFLGTPGQEGPVEILLLMGHESNGYLYWEPRVLDTVLYPGWAGAAGVADLNADGYLDIVVGGWDQFDGLLLYFGDGKGGFKGERFSLESGAGEFNSIAVGDIDGDGVMDIVTNRDLDEYGNWFFQVLYGAKTLKNLYLPHIVQAQGDLPGMGWTTGMQFQNVSRASTTVELQAFSPSGTMFPCGAKDAVAGGSVNFLMDQACPVSPAFSGSGLAIADEPLQGILHVNNAPSGLAGGIYTAMTADDIATTLFFPLVKHNHYGRTTTVVVQNASDSAVDVTATFLVKGVPYDKTYRAVPPRAKIIITPLDAGMPDGKGQVGSLTVIGTGPLAGSTLEHEHNTAVASNLQASRAFTPADYDNVVYCPLFRNAHTGANLTTGAQVQNVTLETQTITLTYTPRDGGPQVTSSQEVEPGASATFYAPFLGIPAGSVGSVTVVSTGNVVAVVNDEGKENGRQRTTTYACFPAKNVTKQVVLPLYKEFWIGNTSGIQIQNVGEEPAWIEVTYIPTNKSGKVRLFPGDEVPPGGSTTFFGVSQGIFPPTMIPISGNPASLANTYGSVIIESDQPIVAIANESGFGTNASLQDSKNYEGFNR